MYGAILTVPSKPEEADLDVFFINTYGYSPMCGHAILAIAKVVLETGIVNKSDQENPEVRISTPAGMVYACTNTHSLTGEVTRTCFKNVPSFVYALDQTVSVPGLGEVKFDIAFGGGFYAILPISSLPLAQEPQILEITPENYSTFISLGRKIRKAILSDPKIAITHPTEPDLSDLYGVIFTSPPHDSKNFSRNVNIFEDGEVDRSPTGTGVSARAALCLERGEVKVGEEWTIESIVGSEMTGKVLEEVMWEGFKSVVPEVGGEAFVMGKNEFYFDPRDGFKEGFMLR